MSEHNMTNQDKLDEMYHLVLENNEMLRGLQRRDRISKIFTFLYWVVILGALGGVYYYISPVVNTVMVNKDKIQDAFNQFDFLRDQMPERQAFNKVLQFIQEHSTSTQAH
jgi:hypothetical protein